MNLQKLLSNKKNIIILIFAIVLMVLIVGFVIYNNTIHFVNSKYSNISLKVISKEYSLGSNRLKVNLKLKNETKDVESISTIDVKVINKDGKEIYSYYENLNETIKSGASYTIKIDEELSKETATQKIKKIEFELKK